MNILAIPSWYPSDEVPLNGVFFMEQFFFLENAGHDIQVIVPPSIYIKSKLDIHRIDFKGATFEWYSNIYTIRLSLKRKKIMFSFLYSILFKNKIKKPDIIHAHGVMHGGRLAVYLGEKWNIPVVLTEHSSFFVTNDKIATRQYEYIKNVLQKVNIILVVGESLKQALQSIVPKRIIQVIGNPVDTSFFRFPDTPKKKIHSFFLQLLFFQRIKA